MRILYENLIDQIESTALTPLTVDTNYPISNIQDQRLSVKYKSDSATIQSIMVELPIYPQFPDNLAGRTYWQDDWATTDSWVGINGTTAVSGGVLVGTATGTPFGIYRDVSGSAGSVIRVKIKASVSILLQFQLKISGIDTLVKTQNVPANAYQYIDIPATSTFTRFIIFYSATIGNTISLDAIYIGSGLYDTPIYDKACCNRLTNHGVLPVKGLRGQALFFNGGQYLQADNPVIGTTGTIAIRFKLNKLPASPEIAILYANTPSDTTYGIRARILSTGELAVFICSASSYQSVVVGTITAGTDISFTLSCNGTTITYSLNGVVSAVAQTILMSQGTQNLTIGRKAHVAESFLDGVINDFRYDSRIWTQDDVTRYHNGDDAVDNSTLCYINLDSQYLVNTVAILGHNLKTGNIKIEANDTSNFTAPALSEYLTYNKEIILKFLSTSYLYKYWKFTFNNQGSIEIGRLWLGEYITIDPSSLLNFKVGKQRSDIITYGRGRQKFSDIGDGWRIFSFAFPKTSYTMIKKIEDLFDSVGLHSSFIFCNFDTIRDYEIVEPCYCSFNKELTFNHTKNMKFEYSVEFEEDL